MNDHQPIRPYRRREQAPDPKREFYSEYPNAGHGHTLGRRKLPVMLGMCRFINGREIERGYACPHYREPDSDE